jgi:N,N'-diacetyllegionaminate synthase
MRPGVIIIAEAGVNHNGSIEIAKQLIEVAADAGADFVKFQTFKTENLVTKAAKKAVYQVENTGDNDELQYNMLKKLELTNLMHEELFDHCTKTGIQFLSTGFDEDSIDYLEELGINLIKIPSGEITNKPYLQHVAHKNKKVVLSTGMAELNEISDALEILTKGGLSLDQITILHCNTEYPTPMKNVNLLAMKSIEAAFGVQVGYSDHTLGIEVSIAAVALGAKVIEKHFTLDRNMEGPDHKASLEPAELKTMISCIRNVELAISGTGEKTPSDGELQNRVIARKSLHLNKEMKTGSILKADDLIALRPGDGISPMNIESVLGKVLRIDLPVFHKLTNSDFL